MPRRNPKVVPQANQALEKFKWEAAEELGLAEKVRQVGWENMTSRECGAVGGLMTKKMVRFAEDAMAQSGGNLVGPTEAEASGTPASQYVQH